MQQVEFWFEFASTYSYPAALRIEEVVRAAGVALSWHPFLLGPIFKAQGWSDSPFNLYPAKGRYMWRDLERVCTALAMPFRRPSQFPRNGLLAARLACHFAGEPWVPDFVRAVYRANFADDRDISDAAVVGSILESVGQSASLLASAHSTDAKSKLRADTERAAALGIFGAPAFVVGAELFWGNDRLERAIDWARSPVRQREDLGRKHQLHGVQPVLPVRDVAASAEYFRDVLGFEIDFLHGEPPVHGRVAKGDGNFGQPIYIHLSKAAPEDVRPSGELRIHVGYDLDGLFAAYRDLGAMVVFEPVTQPWGLREFAVRESNGHMLRFCAEAQQGRAAGS